MPNNSHKTAAAECLYSFRAGKFYQPNLETLKYIIENKAYVISEISAMPQGCRINQGALTRYNFFKKQYNCTEWTKELSARSWHYFGSNNTKKERAIKRINSVNFQLLVHVVSDFIEKNLRIEVSKISLSIYGGYLWNEGPNDLDVIAIIEDKSLSLVEVGGWSIQPVNIFFNPNKVIIIDLSIVGAGAINSKNRNHDLWNILGWYSGGGVTIYGIPPLTIPMPDFIVSYLPLVTLGFCFKELMCLRDNFDFLFYRIDECWKIINWLNQIYMDDDVDYDTGQISFAGLNHSQVITLFLKQSTLIRDKAKKIANKIKEKSIESLYSL